MNTTISNIVIAGSSRECQEGMAEENQSYVKREKYDGIYPECFLALRRRRYKTEEAWVAAERAEEERGRQLMPLKNTNTKRNIFEDNEPVEPRETVHGYEARIRWKKVCDFWDGPIENIPRVRKSSMKRYGAATTKKTVRFAEVIEDHFDSELHSYYQWTKPLITHHNPYWIVANRASVAREKELARRAEINRLATLKKNRRVHFGTDEHYDSEANGYHKWTARGVTHWTRQQNARAEYECEQEKIFGTED